jgi:hypothetical protein
LQINFLENNSEIIELHSHLITFSDLLTVSYVGDSLNMKNCFRGSPVEEKFGKQRHTCCSHSTEESPDSKLQVVPFSLVGITILTII